MSIGLVSQMEATCPQSYLDDVRRTDGTLCFGVYLHD